MYDLEMLVIRSFRQTAVAEISARLKADEHRQCIKHEWQGSRQEKVEARALNSLKNER
jgi:hypothetical protein